MKQQISNHHIPGLREQLIFGGITAAAIALLFLVVRGNAGFSIVKFILASVLMVLFFSVGYFFSYARFYKVEAEDKHLYFSRFLKIEKLEISRIIAVIPEHTIMNLLYRNVYSITVVFLDKKRKERHFKFLSIESNGQVPADLKSLQMLKQLIRFNGDAQPDATVRQ